MILFWGDTQSLPVGKDWRACFVCQNRHSTAQAYKTTTLAQLQNLNARVHSSMSSVRLAHISWPLYFSGTRAPHFYRCNDVCETLRMCDHIWLCIVCKRMHWLLPLAYEMQCDSIPFRCICASESSQPVSEAVCGVRNRTTIQTDNRFKINNELGQMLLDSVSVIFGLFS